jgi:dTDP-4-dehydrorhamnose 3,5-epimerase
MKFLPVELPGLVHIEPPLFGDQRGWFMELWNKSRYEHPDLPANFVQDNVSFSGKGILRGMHMQSENTQGKLVTVLQGEVFDVAVDIRVGSPAFGKWQGFHLDGTSRRQLYIPPGWAHGFLVLSETAMFHYKCTDIYNPKAEISLAWDDPDVGIRWPSGVTPILSEKDKKGLRLRDIPKDKLIKYRGA